MVKVKTRLPLLLLLQDNSLDCLWITDFLIRKAKIYTDETLFRRPITGACSMRRLTP